MRWLLAACGSGALLLAATLGTLIPLQYPDDLEYIFVQPDTTSLAAWCTALFALLGALYLLGLRLTRASPREIRHRARLGTWLAPLSLSGTVILGLTPALPGAGPRAAVLGYFFYDLRWWWLAGLVALAALRFPRPGPRNSTAAPQQQVPRLRWPVARRMLFPTVVFASAVIFACVTSTHIRFTGMLHGDEPRYVRYCELWYEGGGLDVSRVALVADTPNLRPHLLGNLRHVGPAFLTIARTVFTDIVAAWRHPFAYRWNRASADDAFVQGVHGGLYQLHQPGVSLVLLPGYVLDRLFMWSGSSEDGKFPAALPATNFMMLATYGLAGAALYRLLRSALDSERWALAFALLGITSLPASAFAFQLYPEIPVLVIVLVVTRYLWFARSGRGPTAGTMGALAGSMAWFHPRFLLLGLGFAVVAVLRTSGRIRYAFLAGFAVLLASLMAYDYYVTGSWLPTALWDATGEGVAFADVSILFNAIGYGIDRTWGIFPHAPLLIASGAGLLILARTSLPQALFVAGMCGALTLTSAGHTLSAAGTTPDRLIVAVVPLLMWPLALAVRSLWHSPVARACFITAGVMTLDASVRYNLHHEKPIGPMRDASSIGWKPNLAFPVMRGDVWETSSGNFHLFLGIAACLGALTLLAWTGARVSGRPPRGRNSTLASTATVILLLLGWTLATSANGDWASRAYLMDRDTARLQAAKVLVAMGRCRWCTSSTGQPVHWSRLTPNSARSASLSVESRGLNVLVRVNVEGDGGELAFGRYRLDFGDGRMTPWTGVIGGADANHVYAAAGDHTIVLLFQLPDGTTISQRQEIAVGAA
jgi:hypothetical protein